MTLKPIFTTRAEDALEITRTALKRRPTALASAEILRAIDACGPSLARGMFTALEANVSEILDQAREIHMERNSEIVARRLRYQPATLETLVRRASEEALMHGQRRVGTEQLLLAILSVHDDPTTRALRLAGVTQDTARGTLRRLIVSWTDEGEPRQRANVA